MGALLELEGLSAGYGPLRVLSDVHLQARSGSMTAIIGANGAGKTTTLRAVSGMVKTQGRISFDGSRIDGLVVEKVAQRGIAHVPEGRGTLNNLTVEENLRLGAHRLTKRAELAREMDKIFGYFPRLKERLRQPAGTLSGGEQQMLAISRALISRPRLLMLDEPSFGLAPVVVKSIFAVMKSIQQQEQMTILLVEQNVDLAFEAADYCYVMETGSVALRGTADELRKDESVRHTYLGT
jgi:branched-chain amino acid transport system ATP-binding protein